MLENVRPIMLRTGWDVHVYRGSHSRGINITYGRFSGLLYRRSLKSKWISHPSLCLCFWNWRLRAYVPGVVYEIIHSGMVRYGPMQVYYFKSIVHPEMLYPSYTTLTIPVHNEWRHAFDFFWVLQDFRKHTLVFTGISCNRELMVKKSGHLPLLP